MPMRPDERRRKEASKAILVALLDLITSIQSLENRLAALVSQLNTKQENTEKEQSTAKKKDYTVQPTIRSVVELPPDFINNHEAGQNKSYRLQVKDAALGRIHLRVQKRISRYALLTLIAVVIYAGVTALQWRDLRAHFEVEQRAWVGFGDLVRPEFKAGEPVVISVIFTNYGKTPAKKMSLLFSFKTLRPGESFEPTYEPVTDTTGLGAILYPNQRAHVTSQSKVPMTDLRIDAMKNGRTLLHVYGRITYEDIFKEPHWSTFCFYFDRSLTDPTACNTYNDAN